MPDFIYRGARTSVTLKLDGGEERDLILIPDRAVADLPANHPYVAALVAQKLLVPVPSEPSADRPKKGAK